VRKFLNQLYRTAKSKPTRSFSQGTAGVVLFWAILRYALREERTPDSLHIFLYLLYCVFTIIFCNYHLSTGRWSISRWANRMLLLSLPLPAFYGYFAFLVPEYFAVLVVFVSSIGLPVLGLMKTRYWTLWYAIYLSVYLGLLAAYKVEYLGNNLAFVILPVLAVLVMHYWLILVSRNIKNMNSNLSRHLAETKKHKRHLDRLHRGLGVDLTLARRLQQDTLPDPSAFRGNHMTIAGKYLALESVGGDFYDLVDLGGGKTGLFIADVSGHGVSAALVTMMTKAVFRNHCRDSSDPSLVLKTINASLQGFLEKQHMFVSAFYCILDEKGSLSYSSAGHQPLLIVRNSPPEIFELSTDNAFYLGIEPDWNYSSAEFKLKDSDRILLYTDGLVEARSRRGGCYGDKRYHEFLLANQDMETNAFLNGLIDDLYHFLNGEKQEDDIAVLCVDFKQTNQ